MPHAAAAKMANRGRDAGRYQRNRPEQTLLYRIVAGYYPAFTAHPAEQGKELPDYVQREFEDCLQCGRLEHGFLRGRCESCHAEHRGAFSCKRRGFCPSCGARRMAESAALLVDGSTQYAGLITARQGFVIPDGGKGGHCGEKGAGFQRSGSMSVRFGGIARWSGDSRAVSCCWTCAKRAFILPIYTHSLFASNSGSKLMG